MMVLMVLSSRRCDVNGFALPTILIASIVMLIVLLSSVSAAAGIRSALDEQYYTKLAQEAAEAGQARADACLAANSYVATWTDNSRLRPDTTCSGATISGGNRYVVTNGNIRTTFVVWAPIGGTSGSAKVTVVGTTELVRTSTNSVHQTYTHTLVQQSSYSDIPQIASGAGWKDAGHNGYMLTPSGVLYGWGDNAFNQLGDASLGTVISTPIKISLPAGTSHVKKMRGSGQGAAILCILASDDQVYCRGSEGIASQVMTDWVQFELAAGRKAIDLEVSGYGRNNACVIDDLREVWCAGMNDRGEMGNGIASADAAYQANYYMNAPTKFRLDLATPAPPAGTPLPLKAMKVFTKDFMTCVIADDERAYCAGMNNHGQLGHGNNTVNVAALGQSRPGRAMIPADIKVTDVKLSYHGAVEGAFFMGANGTAYMSGHNQHGTAADGNASGSNTAQYYTPKNITGGGFNSIYSIGDEGLDRHSVCVGATSAGTMYCVGRNNHGQLGNPSLACGAIQATQILFSLPAGESVIKMNDEAGYQMNSMMVITASGKVFAAGDNTYGKLGTTHPLQACNPAPREVLMPFVPGSTTQRVKAVALANGDEYSAFILGEDGKLYAMGRNNLGQLGDGTTIDRSVPTEVKIPRQSVLF
jgi:alpha-tubulin suppressor-like RCC1 family protein